MSNSTHAGEPVSPETSFRITEYPPFLRHHPHNHLDHTSQQAPSICTHTTEPHTKTNFNTQPLDLTCSGPSGGPANTAAEKLHILPTHSLATPGDSNGEKTITFVTPDLFDNPVVGKAVASSTPAAGPRSLVFTGQTGKEGTQGQGVCVCMWMRAQ